MHPDDYSLIPPPTDEDHHEEDVYAQAYDGFYEKLVRAVFQDLAITYVKEGLPPKHILMAMARQYVELVVNSGRYNAQRGNMAFFISSILDHDYAGIEFDLFETECAHDFLVRLFTTGKVERFSSN